jgi:hypothetical protein
LEGDRGDQSNFIAGHEGWKFVVSRFDSEFGSVLEHISGTFALPNNNWLGPNGVTTCQPGDGPQSPWKVATELLLGLWTSWRRFNARATLIHSPRRAQRCRDLWTWGGVYFGQREGDDLWTHSGRHVGRFRGEEVYRPNGRYLGEVKSDKLITRLSSQSRSISPFAPHAPRVGHVPYVGSVGTVMYVGYEDFPGPERFQ